MPWHHERLKRFLASDDGPVAVEYAVMLAVIVAVCMTVIQALGTSVSEAFRSLRHRLAAAQDGNTG